MPAPLPPDTIVYAHGDFRPLAQASYALEERGVLFADGVYEVVRYDRGKPFALKPHADRLANSLDGIDLPGLDADEVADLSNELVKRAGHDHCKVYWQVTRGDLGPRDFLIQTPTDFKPNLTLIAYPTPPLQRDATALPPSGGAIIVEDCRWTKCWIKSLMLQPASLAKTAAHKAGAVEAIFEREKPGTTESHITEGSSTNVFIVRDGQLLTHPNDGWVLPGITRDVLLDAAQNELGLPFAEQTFTAADLKAADEVFVCSTTQLTAITSVHGQPIGDGQPGPITTAVNKAYTERILAD